MNGNTLCFALLSKYSELDQQKIVENAQKVLIWHEIITLRIIVPIPIIRQYFYEWQYFKIQEDIVIHYLLSTNSLFHNWKISLKGQISSQNVSFYLRIQYSRSKIAGPIYSEKRG